MSLIEGDVERKEKFLRVVQKFGPLIAFLAYVAGIVTFCLLPHQIFQHGTYISENALLPGLVNSDIHSADAMLNFNDKLKSLYETKKKLDLDDVKRLFPAKIETHFQNFNVSNPFMKSFPEFNPEIHLRKSRNLYGLSRAQRADGTESIVITAPLYVVDAKSSKSSDKQIPNLLGLSMLLVLAEISQTKPYWAKDLIFVVPEINEIGMQTWINAYFDIQSEFISSENLNRRGGSIQAALNLEFADLDVSKLELKLEGPNGKLPNLDLFNTVIRVCRSVQFECSLESEKSSRWDTSDYFLSLTHHSRPALDHVDGLENTLAMVFRQATGLSSSLHGYFLNHRIESLTFQGAKSRARRSSTQKQNVLKAVRVVEGTMRSVNNLLERFHQSFFFYLLPSSHYYISIGLYMPAFGLVALPLLIQILTIWFSIFYKKSSTLDDVRLETSSLLFNLFRIVLPKIFIAISFGLLLHFGTPYFVYFGKKFQLTAKDSLINCYVAIIVNILAAPILINLKIGSERNYLFELSEKILRLLSLLQLTIFLGTLSLLNFSLAFLISLFYVPAALLAIQSVQNRLLKAIQLLVWLAANPLVYFFVLFLAHGYWFGRLDLSKPRAIFDTSSEHFYNLILMSKLANIWTYDFVNLCLVPIWSLFWFIAFPNFS